MNATRSCWKRLHAELEDGDECLPISKRICSLHIEPHSQELNSQSSHGALIHPCNGFSDSSIQSPLVLANHGQDRWSITSHPESSHRLDLNSELFFSNKPHGHHVHENCVQSEVNQANASAGHQYGQPLGNAHSPSGAYQQKLDPNFNQDPSGNLLCMPSSSYDQQNTAQQNQQISQTLGIHNENSTIYTGIHGDSFSITPREGMPEYTHDFHIQQLPTGVYDPELGMDENPYYYNVNQLLYEAHLYRVRRGNIYPNSS